MSSSSLHSDAIHWEEDPTPGLAQGGKVVFKHYVGIGARRYVDLFSLKLSSGRRVKRKQQDGRIALWDRATAEPRVPFKTASIVLEGVAIDEITTALKGST